MFTIITKGSPWSRMLWMAIPPLVALVLGTGAQVRAQESEMSQAPSVGVPLHPAFPLLDASGNHVLASGLPVSTMQTCSGCHDTAFISGHSFHADAGLETMTAPGETGSGRSWDTSSGPFGRWNPLTYRYLSPDGDERIDLTTAEWLKLFGARHVGGGPATTSRDGQALVSLIPSAGDVETSIVDQSGEAIAWDWAESGVVEMNCFLCHLANPDNEARKETLQAGAFGWANSATLMATGVIDRRSGEWQWNEKAFDGEGNVNPELVSMQDPGDDNCGLCHGLVHVDAQQPLILDGCAPEQWSTITTGQIMSPQRISDSGLNVAGKVSLRRSWDVHSERLVSCTECHYSLNNPVYYQELTESRPEHLLFDPRRIDLGEYLYRPLHQFAKGESVQGRLAPGLDHTIRGCDDCHETSASHDWLPYTERHTTALSCEACHVPKMIAPARQFTDWTVLGVDGYPQSSCRGLEEEGETFSTSLVTGFEPVLLPRSSGDGPAALSPYNLITSWYWVYGDPARPVPYGDLRSAWLGDEGYQPEVLALFDENEDGRLDEQELIIDDRAKENLIATLLRDRGLADPRITAEVQPYNINHNVTHGEWATRECAACHSESSRIDRPMLLAERVPAGVLPEFISDGTTSLNGELAQDASGALYYQPRSQDEELYILGYSGVNAIDKAGAGIFVAVLVGVMVHGGIRLAMIRRRDWHEPALRQVYMYAVYERLWHWLQTAAIVLLLFTGLIIHKPDLFGIFSFRYAVQVHNILAVILVANAALALFYHLASGEIRQYLPEPTGLFRQAIVQASYYLRGIFRGEHHPFDKTPRRRMNPLQQITYVGLLNVLLPLQIVTGILMWGAQRWPQVTAQLGGLTYLAPVHTMVSWLLASFIVGHVYLTTTGATPLASIRAMMTGWDGLEAASPVQGD